MRKWVTIYQSIDIRLTITSAEKGNAISKQSTSLQKSSCNQCPERVMLLKAINQSLGIRQP